MLGDAIVRYVLHDLDLPWANVVLYAGGNFMLLVPGGKEADITRLSVELNGKLLDLHRAELHLALAHVEIEARQVVDASHRPEPGSLAYARRELRRGLAAAKDSPFAALPLQDDRLYTALFGVQGRGGPVHAHREEREGGTYVCAICQVEVDPEAGTLVELPPEGPGDEPTILCEQCRSLGFYRVGHEDEQEMLPFQLGRAETLLIRPITPDELDEKYRQPHGGSGNPAWDAALRSLGFDYKFYRSGQKAAQEGQGHLLYLNRDKFDVGKKPGIAYGFWPLARHTPWQNPDQRTIRDFHVMARYDATGLPRYGVLRMDVDDLGRTLFGTALSYPDLLHLSAFSAALNGFFGTRLDAICEGVAETWKTSLGRLDEALASVEIDGQTVTAHDRKAPYVIYAGGDDLFIVGAWDILPALADTIHAAFIDYSQERLTMSGGISLAREKYPLYKAAEDAGAALDEAKTYAGKNAVTFLGKTLAWPELGDAQKKALKLAGLIQVGVEEDGQARRAPHALLTMLNHVAYLYHQQAGPEEPAPVSQVALGRWLWVLHYGLRRIGQRVRPPLREDVYYVAQEVVVDASDLGKARAFGRVRYLDLIARWAEFLIRKGEKSQWLNNE